MAEPTELTELTELEKRLREVLRQAAEGPAVTPDVAELRSHVRRRRMRAAAAACGLLAVPALGGVRHRPRRPWASRPTAGPAAGRWLVPPELAPSTTVPPVTTSASAGAAPPRRVLAEGTVGTPGRAHRWALSYGADVTEFVALTVGANLRRPLRHRPRRRRRSGEDGHAGPPGPARRVPPRRSTPTAAATPRWPLPR